LRNADLNRGWDMRWPAAAAATTAVFVLALTHVHSQPDRLPNFVIVFTDDQGYGDLGSYGHPTLRTPNIDRLATEGQRWTSFYASPLCTPSRAELLTGRLAVRTGLSTGVLYPDSTGGLQPSEITLAEVLKARGYATKAIGKWHLGVLPEYLPTNQGFDSYYGVPYSNDMDGAAVTESERFQRYIEPRIEYYNVPLQRDSEIIERPAEQATLTGRYTDEAIAFITAHRDRPFFLYLAHNMPHMPLFRSKEFENRSARGRYGDVIEEIDANVGRLLETLRDLQIERNTLILYLSDNGPWAAFSEQGGSAGPLRGAKNTTWEGGMRVPAIFWWPGTILPGVITGMGSVLDVMPTFAAFAGGKTPPDRVLDGFDLSPVLRRSAASPRDTLFYYDVAGLAAVRRGPHKLHLMIPPSGTAFGERALQGGAPQLYNLDEDPSERFDRAITQPDLVAALRHVADEHKRTVVPVRNQIDTRRAPAGRAQ
jgi:arylsulfatase A